MQAGASFKLMVRSHLPLTQTLASQKAALPSPFSRAVFLFDYADSELLHSLESTFRAVNAQCLGLYKSPGALAAQAKAASVAGSPPTDAGMISFLQSRTVYLNAETSSYTGDLNSKPSGDSKNAFVHCGDFLG